MKLFQHGPNFFNFYVFTTCYAISMGLNLKFSLPHGVISEFLRYIKNYIEDYYLGNENYKKCFKCEITDKTVMNKYFNISDILS